MNTYQRWFAVALLVSGICIRTAQAVPTVNLSTQGVGFFTPTVIPPPNLDNTYLSDMINTYNGGVFTLNHPSETYSKDQGSNTPSTLPMISSLQPEVGVNGSPTSFQIDLGAGGSTYLVAQWDGPNGADAVYYISGMSGLISLSNDVPNKSQYGLSGYWFGTSNSNTVPDGGLTALCVGLGCLGLAAFRRRFA